MTKLSDPISPVTIGLDIGDRNTHYCVLGAARVVVARGAFSTTPRAMSDTLAAFHGRVVLEAGSQSPWISRQLRSEGFDVHVADPRRVQLISKDPRKTDRRDAETLARLEAGMPEVLGTIHHRGEQAQADLSNVRARDLLVRMRTMAVQQARSLSKAFGVRLPSASTAGFPQRVHELLPELLLPAVNPILGLVTELTRIIREMDRSLAKMVKTRYPEVAALQQVDGVGPVTAATFVLSLEDPHRFTKSRRVGSWLGLCPRSHASGGSDADLGVSKAGDSYLRRLLVQCGHYILGPFGKDSDLRRFGLRLAGRGGRGAKKRAAVAVARKLAVLLHRLWRNGLVYEPLHNAERKTVSLGA